MSRQMREKILATLLSCIIMTSALSGCGKKAADETAGGVALLDPAGIALNYEEAAYRNLYDVTVLNALVCPYVEEYTVGESGKVFESYVALPGDPVAKGETIIRTDTENLEDQMDDLKERMLDEAQEYQEYMTEEGERRYHMADTEKYWKEVLAIWEGDEPSEDDFRYEGWAASHYMFYTKYQDARIALEKEDEALRQRSELFYLDYTYNELRLRRLQEDIDNSTVLSEMSGVVTNIRLMDYGEWMTKDNSMVAVADLNRKLLKADFISKMEVGKAKEIYAVIDGRRYEVEYEPMDTEEYEKLKEENDIVFTTFHLGGNTDEVAMGSYAVIVVVKDYREHVLTVPLDAVVKEDGNSYVYVLQGGESTLTPVKTGMKDGAYVEILSGLEAGDKILTEKAAKAAGETVTLTMGSVHNTFTGSGYLVYPIRELIKNPVKYGTAYLEEILVRPYQQVEEGELLVRIRVKPDEAELKRTERSLQRERERLGDMLKEREKLVEEKEEAEKEGDYSTRYKDAIKAQDKAIAAKQKVIADLEEHLAELNADFAVKELRAPYSGVITSVSWSLKEGDLLDRNQWFVQIARTDSSLILLEDKNGILTYGNLAALDYRGEQGNMTASGMVVSLNKHSITKNLFGDDNSYAIIKVSAEDLDKLIVSTDRGDWWNRTLYNVTVTTRSMENVLLIPKKAVSVIGGATYVRVINENGEAVYQSFVAGGSDNAYYWVVEGLTEGMEVCIE